MKKIISVLCIVVTFLNLSACGTILYPERKNKPNSNKLDVAVVLLDGVGLFFLLIPGVIAYAVDFNNGTIYLPRGAVSSIDELNTKNMTAINIGRENLTAAKIKKIVSENTGRNADAKNLQVYKIDNQGKKVAVVL